MTGHNLDTRTVRTRIETTDSDSPSSDAPIATFEYGDDHFGVPATVDLVIWLDRAVAHCESMSETLDHVLDAWIERYCTQLCGGYDSDAADHLHHNVMTTRHLKRTFQAAAIKHIGCAKVDVADEFEPTVDTFLAEVTDQVGDISLSDST